MGSLKNIEDKDTFNTPDSAKAARAIAAATDFATVYWGLNISHVTLTHGFELEKEDYAKYGLPLPISLATDPQTGVEEAREEETDEEDTDSGSDVSGPRGFRTPAQAREALQELGNVHNQQNHPFHTTATTMATITQTVARARLTQQSGGVSASGPSFGAGMSAGPAQSNYQPPPVFTPGSGGFGAGGGGGGGGDPPDGDDRGGRDEKKSKRKKKKKKKKYSSDSSEDSSEDDRRRRKKHKDSGNDFHHKGGLVYHCRGRQCDYTFETIEQKHAHEEICQLLSDRDNRKEPWGHAINDLNKYNIKVFKREIAASYDDNLNNLHEARWFPMPVGWHTPHAAQPTEALQARHSYPFDALGLNVANRRLVINLHSMSFTEYSLAMMTKANLKRPNVRYSQKAEKRDADEIALVSL